jgi:ABC-2 type transport system ATP-binding protein
MSDQETAIKVTNLSKDFVLPHFKVSSLKELLVHPFRKRSSSEVQNALDGISFEVQKGDFFGIVGRNGSGKSTLLKLLAGIYAPTAGDIQINGSLVPFIELGVGFNPELSGRDNVYLNGALLGFNREDMARMYDEIVEFAELERFMDQKLKNYSSGMQVRLAFSIAIRADSDILLLDEVLAVGDEAFQRKCFSYFAHLKKKKKTVVLVTHDMSAVQRFCTDAILLEDGGLTLSGKATVVADQYRRINLQSSIDEKKSDKAAEAEPTSGVTIKKAKQDSKHLVFSMKADQRYKEETYFGFSIINDGTSIAELNSLGSYEFKEEKPELSYQINLKSMNPGSYEVTCALFSSSDRGLLAICDSRLDFVVSGSDKNRGGTMSLEKNWIKE